VICPTKAISWRENQETIPTILTSGILPPLNEEIRIRTEACKLDCELACKTACPSEAVSVITDKENGEERIVDVQVDPDRCFYCGKCQSACPYELISVKKARLGLVSFDPRHCPPRCQACTDVCPSGAMHIREGQVELDEAICIYCSACTSVCPVDEALEVKREKIQGLPLPSKLWVELQGKLVSPEARVRLIRESAEEKRRRAFKTRID
jgi:4Fe-4S ferredoxin